MVKDKSPKIWRNKPKKKIVETDDSISFRVPERTDCWRKTRGNFIADNAPFYWHKVMGDFEITCKISGTFQNNYDKAGIMIRVDEENWILTGMEYYNSRMHHSTSVTNDFTDWTLSLLPVGCETNGVYFKFVRQKVFYECSYSDDNGETWTQTRCGEFTERQTISVGVAGACPMGEEFRVTFDDYQCKSL